ncbi:MAG: L-aspartate oxidase [Candidatus Fermentibacteraceae bacterium]|nr:L-aspartate oxidase [Candidatus Fermentibacteraceae bacterium]
MTDNVIETDVLILGAGMAGLTCALSLPEGLRVMMVSKVPMPTGSTYLAQGGLAAAVSEEDSFQLHLRDTVEAGAGLVNEEVALEIIEGGPRLVMQLARWGAELEGASGGGKSGIEGGHSVRRVLHHKDRTGRLISEVLSERCFEKGNIRIIQPACAVNLLTASREMPELVDGGMDRCIGAHILHDGTISTVLAGETVIATGGAGKVYRYTSNQDSATGDGIAMAYRAGLPIRNMEFYQFHPTCLFHPEKRNFLVTEALRGEGAILLNLEGERFMENYDPERMELAPRDIVARAIDSEMKRLGNDHVLLDASRLGRDKLTASFPEVTDGVTSVGIIPWEEPIPVVPAAHYIVGGIDAATDGTTLMNGLRAIGEASCTGFHGANRLGSNSLLEAGVMGLKAADSIPGTVMRPSDFHARDWSFGRAEPLRENVLVDHAWAAIRSVMWDYVGIVRSDNKLHRALRLIDVLADEVEEDYWSLLPVTGLLELRNICTVSRAIIMSALRRRESRGLHFNMDCPEPHQPPRDTLIRLTL